MKKTVLSVIACALAALSLCSCAARDKTPQHIVEVRDPFIIEQPNIGENDIDRDNDDDFQVPPRPGIRRHVRPELFGNYEVEYIHTPYYSQKDETLDVKLELKQDNTYNMNVTVAGVSATHYGHWYENGNGIILFYDEPIDTPAHNVYVGDCAYIELIPHGKFMFNEGGSTIVLSKSPSSDDTISR